MMLKSYRAYPKIVTLGTRATANTEKATERVLLLRFATQNQAVLGLLKQSKTPLN